jgi:multidrug resistance efflux pump
LEEKEMIKILAALLFSSLCGASLFAAAPINSVQINSKPIVAQMNSMIEGQIVYEVPLGSHVKKGQVVEEVDPREYQANILKDLSAITYFSELFKSDSRLIKTHSIAYCDYLLSQYNYRAALSSYQQDKAILDHCKIYSPFNGYVSKITTYPGSGIGDGSLIMNITKDNNSNTFKG